MPLDLAAFVAELRAAGVQRIDLELTPGVVTSVPEEFLTPEQIQSIIDPPPEVKPAGVCTFPGCNAPNGHQFAPEYCRTHALAAAGVD